jgi:hypothetical protein
VPSVRISTSFFTLLNPIWVSDLRTPGKTFFILKSMADICHFVFLVHAECALKKLSTDVLRLLFFVLQVKSSQPLLLHYLKKM